MALAFSGHSGILVFRGDFISLRACIVRVRNSQFPGGVQEEFAHG